MSTDKDGPIVAPDSGYRDRLDVWGRSEPDFIQYRLSDHHPFLLRAAITERVSKPRFGLYCTKAPWQEKFFDCAAEVSRKYEKTTDVVCKVWTVRSDESWLQTRLNLQPRSERSYLKCVADVYNYQDTPAGTLVVDFANSRVGGGCFGGGFVQEEQMVTQSTDFAVRLKSSRELIKENSACTYEGVHIDIWWTRENAAQKNALDISAVQECCSNPLTVIAVDAPVMRGIGPYDLQALQTLAKKTFLVFKVARRLSAPCIFSGLLGGGAFRGNRPLILLLHMLLQPSQDAIHVRFHNPIFWSFSSFSIPELERAMLIKADDMLEKLREKGVTTLLDAFGEILSWQLPTSQDDRDIVEH